MDVKRTLGVLVALALAAGGCDLGGDGDEKEKSEGNEEAKRVEVVVADVRVEEIMPECVDLSMIEHSF